MENYVKQTTKEIYRMFEILINYITNVIIISRIYVLGFFEKLFVLRISIFCKQLSQYSLIRNPEKKNIVRGKVHRRSNSKLALFDCGSFLDEMSKNKTINLEFR